MRVDSSYIQSLQYDKASKVLRVRFSDGALVDYPQTHPRTYQALLDADSHGEKFHELMAGKKFVVIKEAV